MNCITCKLNKIGPNAAPFGGFLCINEHLQCHICNAKSNGQCGICEANTSFVQMNFNTSSAAVTSIEPTAPPLEAIEQKVPVSAVEKSFTAAPVSNHFPKHLFEQLETQSSLSQEHLSMHESHELISLGSPEPEERKIDEAEMAAMRMQQFVQVQPIETMETIFMGQQPQSKFTSNSTYSPHLGNTLVNMKQPSNALHSTPEVQPLHKVPSMAKKRSNENKLLRKNMLDEFDDSDIIHTSELRFIESSESLKNYYSGGTMHQPVPPDNDNKLKDDQKLTASSHQQQISDEARNEQELLSTKLLHDFESQNRAQPTEMVENYLRNYGPVAMCNFPAYSAFHHHHHGGCGVAAGAGCYHTHHCEMWNQRQQPQAPMRSISVSTESEPNLGNSGGAITGNGIAELTNKREHEFVPPPKYIPQEYYVMHATGMPQPVVAAPAVAEGMLDASSSQKTATPSIDIRMQKVLETFTEEPRQTPLSEKPLLAAAQNFIKIPTSSSASASPRPDEEQQATTEAELDVAPEIVELEVSAEAETDLTSNTTEKDVPNDLASRLSNSHRAFYNPPTTPVRAIRCNSQPPPIDQPSPQFQLITCCTLVANELAMIRARYLDLRPIPACHLNIPRAPVQCPESTCQRMIFVSDFNKHLIVDHSRLPMERIATRQCKNFFIDPRLSRKGVSKCHMLYLIRDKISDLGSSKFKDFLPLLVMSTRINLSDLCGVPATVLGDEDIDFLMVWLTGIAPEEFPVSVSLTVWSRAGPSPVCHIVHSGQMYSIRQSPRHADICRSGQTMLLAASEVHLLTKGGRDMLELQLVVH